MEYDDPDTSKVVLVLTLLVIALSLLLSASLISSSAKAQEVQQKDTFTFAKKPASCEINLMRLERLARLAPNEIGNGGVLIAVARNGDFERSNELARRRLYNVRAFLTEYQPFKDEQVVTAQGSAVKGYGRVEIYLGGKLVDVFLAERNKDLCVDCCDRDSMYYPYRKSGNR